MKTGTRVEVDAKSAKTWGFKTPALGTVIGPDPLRRVPCIVAVKLDEESPSIYETRGVHVARLTAIADRENKNKKAAIYGFCPMCGQPGVYRERKPGGNDRCAAGHVYPSSIAQSNSEINSRCTKCGGASVMMDPQIGHRCASHDPLNKED